MIALAAAVLFVWPGLLRAPDRPSGVIIFQGGVGEGSYGIFTVPARGGEVHRFPIPLKGKLGFPRFSPDGRSLAFIGEDSTGREDLFVADARGRNPRAIAPSPERPEGAPAWSPDGTSIVFASQRDGNWEIYSVHPDGSALRRLTDDAAFDSTPVYSPDGRTIAFTSDRGGGDDSHVFVMNVDGTGVRQITSRADESAPDFSPDGRRIAFVRLVRGEADIWISDADGSNPHPVSAEPIFEHTPRWSPDGRWIAFEGYIKQFPDLYLVRSDGSSRIRLTDTGSYAGSPAWVPAGGG